MVAAGSAAPTPPPGPPESIGYVIESYLPFLAVTVGYPLAGALYLALRALRASVSGRALRRPDSPAYTVYLIAGVLPLMGVAAAFFKAYVDYVYGAPYRWRVITSEEELRVYLSIAGIHVYTHFLAGLAGGLLLLLPLARRTYDSWLADLVVYGGNLAWYLALSTRPLQDFVFSYAVRKQLGLPPGLSPYDLVAARLHESLLAGLALGAIAAAALGWRLRGAPTRGRPREVWLPPGPPGQPTG